MILGGIGLLGALTGHLVGYWAAHPEQGGRHEVLEASGHGYFDMAMAVALAAALMALVGQAVMGYRGESQTRSRWATAVDLAVTQISVFVSVEIAERALNGASLNIFGEPALWLGLSLQVGIAVLGAMLLTAVRKAGSLLAKLKVSLARAGVSTLSVNPVVKIFISRWFGFSFLSRGPPAHSLT